MSVAALRPSAVVYREEQYFDWPVYALVAVLEAIAVCLPTWAGRHGPNLTVTIELWDFSINMNRVIAVAWEPRRSW